MFASIAYAMGPQPGAPAGDGMSMLASFMPFILMFIIFWFLLIRPQQKRAKAHREMLESLGRGDAIITHSGLLGKILEIDKEEILLECGDAKLRLSRSAVGGVVEKKDKKDKKDKKNKKETDDKQDKAISLEKKDSQDAESGSDSEPAPKK